MRLRLVFVFLVCLPIIANLPITAQAFAQMKGFEEGMLRTDTFGAGWATDSLANVEIGRFLGRVVSYRFRASHTGTFSAIELFLAFRTICDGCYANGNGGTIQLQVQTDDGTSAHLPSGTVLGSTIINNPMLQWNRVLTFAQPVSLQSGSLYHMVFTNLAADPVHNYISLDTLYLTAGGTNLQPAANTIDLAVLVKLDSKNPLLLNSHDVPIFSIFYDDGYRQGQIYIDVKHNAITVAPGFQVAEAFVVQDTNRLVSTLAIRLDPLVTQGDVNVVLNNAYGQPLAAGTINLSTATQYSYNWFSISFPEVMLMKGGSYSIVLSPENGAQFYLSPIQQGGIYGFQWENFYTSQCQVPNGTKWGGCLGRTDLDIPFYFR